MHYIYHILTYVPFDYGVCHTMIPASSKHLQAFVFVAEKRIAHIIIIIIIKCM